jgi:O-acetyl-ADP-ribose deacetylase (regulator of RNase III)/ubiquinone/menaquinone biosynthesis C-methylase UbiE
MSYYCIVKQGNLLNEENATFIVNASNTKLILGSGVSMAFDRHCGRELQNEVLRSLKNIGESLKQGDVVATSAGQADNFKYALHAAIMDYNTGIKHKDNALTLEVIRRSLVNIEGYLEWYAQQSTKPMKLVLPLMGCGVGGLNIEEVAQLYNTYFEREVSFDCEVVVYGYSKEDYDLIKPICMQESKAHSNWANYYDFVNDQSFGSFLNNLTIQTIEVINRVLHDTNKTIIDFGAGTGRMSLPLAKQGYEIIAVEPSKNMLNSLKEKFQKEKLSTVTYQTTLQEYLPKKKADLGIVVFTVFSYLTTKEDLDAAIKVMAMSIKEGGYIFMDIASEALFESSHFITENMDRDIQISPLGHNRYKYMERCSGKINGSTFSYKDTFIIRHWTAEHILKKMYDVGFILKEDISEKFATSGAEYYLFQKDKFLPYIF